MARIKPRTPPGTLELLPLEQIAFQRMLDTIRRNFERYGFVPVETPVLEFAEILLTKSGGETERQVYFVQSTGSLKQGDDPELALRFDLTVPLARYVAEHERELSFPFRRYQIQRVYRGESAQRGRFREFYQCDIDVIGKDALSVRYDAEMPAVIHSVFSELAIGPFTIQLNNRRLMRGMLGVLGVTEPAMQAAFLREIDKLDKQGREKVWTTLMSPDFGLPEKTHQQLSRAVNEVWSVLGVKTKTHDEALFELARVRNMGPSDAPESARAELNTGVGELVEVLEVMRALGVPESAYSVNLSIARGLDYYTGTVYETTLDGYPQVGSICSGGRYDDLASQYTSSRLPGVGISIGLTRLFWQLRDAGLLQPAHSTVQALVTNMDDAQLAHYLQFASELRNAGIATEVQLEAKKLGKQFQYADRAGIRFVLVLGPDEIAQGVVTVKDLREGTQSEVPRAQVADRLRRLLAGP